MQWKKRLQSDRTLKFSYWISLVASPTKASKYPPLSFFLVAVPAGGQEFYMAFSVEGEDRSCSFTTTNTNSHTGEQRTLPEQRAGGVLDLHGQKKKNTRIIQNLITVIQGRSWRLSVYLGWLGESWEVSWPSTAMSWENIFWQRASPSMEQR